MKLAVENEFIMICNEIIDRNLSLFEWQDVERCDEFQTLNYF